MSSPDDNTPAGDDNDVDHADLQAALGDLLSGDDAGSPRGPGGEPADLGSDELDLSMLEDAVAELGIDVGNQDDEPGAPREIDLGTDADVPARRPNPGLDLTELPPPPGPASAGAAEPVKKLPPLGQASAADLFGDEDWGDDDLDGETFDLGADDGPAATPPPSPSFDDPAPAMDDPIQVQVPDAPRATPATEEVIAFAAHKGRLTGDIAAKAKKLFGR